MVQGRRQQLFPTAENNNADTRCKTLFSDQLYVYCAVHTMCTLCTDPSIVEVEAESVMGLGEEPYYFLNIDAPIKHRIPFHYHYLRHHTL